MPTDLVAPNIVYILADDMGYGDVGCLNPECKIPTPHMDRLASQGMLFGDAHSNSAVCTPTRYGVLTGRYCWRSRLQRGVLGGYSPHLIEAGRLTVPQMLRGAGYRTGCIGKWHLGMDWRLTVEGELGDGIDPAVDPSLVDYAAAVAHGPTARGFDEFFGISASLDMPPYTYIENDRVTEPPTGLSEGGQFPENWRPGPAAPGFRHEEVLPRLTARACEYIERSAGQDGPFFLYFPLPSPHAPVLPIPRFRGVSRAGSYGDFVAQTDDSVGRVMAALDACGLADNTLLVVTSDNGSTFTNEALAQYGHLSNYHFRGCKSDAWDGGHRIPFMARWPGRIAAGGACGQLICLTDLMATCAEILGLQLPVDAGEDSISMLPLLLGTAGAVREDVVHHSVHGRFAIRKGRWKLVQCKGSGGWSLAEEEVGPDAPPGQLYDMESDPAEQCNLYHRHPQIVKELTDILHGYRVDGRSR
jgi:arylsulfatase A-like enzyme